VLIPRTGLPALRLEGYGLAAAETSERPAGLLGLRYHEIEWWSHDVQLPGPEQRHCLVVRYRSKWEGELGHDQAHLLLRRDLEQVLRSIDPTEHVQGFPEGEHYAQKQRRLLQTIRLGYEHAVSRLLEKAKVWELGD
jgi:hypothetical protein